MTADRRQCHFSLKSLCWRLSATGAYCWLFVKRKCWKASSEVCKKQNMVLNPHHVFIAGAQKCGTSTLFNWLRGHPSLCTAVKREYQGSVKELHFFAGNNWRRGFDWYAAQYLQPELRCIDATPLYLSSSKAPPRIARVFPGAKIIVTLRDPVARAMSQFNHYCQDLPDSENWDWRCPGAGFSENINEELRSPFPDWQGLLGRGKYAEQLRYWHQFLPSHRMLILVMEEWSANCDQAYKDILDFLELDFVPRDSLDAAHRRTYQSNIKCDDSARRLADYFAPANREFYELIGREVPAWEKSCLPGS